jgi:hypothetical protein
MMHVIARSGATADVVCPRNPLLHDSTSFLHGSGDYHREYAWRGFAFATLRLGMTIAHLHLDEVLDT